MAALLDLRMPGVYTQEIATLPPTVGVIPSAVPVFIGYTEKADKKGESLMNLPTRIKSMKEYEEWFGGPPKTKITVDIDDSVSNPKRPEVRIVKPVTLDYKMYHSMLFYYANGGGPCFVISIGTYKDKPDDKKMSDALTPLIKSKDVTIIVYPDGTSLDETKYKAVIEASLLHCVKMKNRVTVIDLHDSNGEDLDKIETGFQTNMPSDIEIKKYGMAYYPYLETVFSLAYNKEEVTVNKHIQSLEADVIAELSKQVTAFKTAFTNNTAAGKVVADWQQVFDSNKDLKDIQTDLDAFKLANNSATNDDLKNHALDYAKQKGIIIPVLVKTELDKPNPDPIKIIKDAIDNGKTELDKAEAAKQTTETKYKDAVKEVQKGFTKKVNNKDVTFFDYTGLSMSELESINNLLYGKIKDAISSFPVTLPPCGAVAGIYVRTDATQGVWKAPANVSVFGTIKPALDIDDDLHASLNAPSSGKAINVIRAYPGRGILVYGGRTLAGNDLEWRYVNVRRTFCFIEDSIARAMQDFVFEPNNQQTWIKVRAMIKSFLNRLWKAGGLYGNTPEDAYEVIVGEPESMSVEDVLSGIMRIFIKVAVARPAEFIVLQYEHKFELSEA